MSCSNWIDAGFSLNASVFCQKTALPNASWKLVRNSNGISIDRVIREIAESSRFRYRVFLTKETGC